MAVDSLDRRHLGRA